MKKVKPQGLLIDDLKYKGEKYGLITIRGDFMEEEWKPIKNYEGIYIISNLGRIKRIIPPIRFLKPTPLKNGYLKVGLWKNGKGYYVTLHRLVANHFVDNPHNYPQINHKDEVKTNNCASNLEWCTCKYNSNYGHRVEKIIAHTDYSSRSKPVKQIKDGKTIKIYPSISEAQRQLGLPLSAKNYISLACRHISSKHQTVHGYEWKYVDTTKKRKSNDNCE